MLRKALKKILHKDNLKRQLPTVLFVVILLCAGILAITQEAQEDTVLDEFSLDDMFAVFPDGEEGEGIPPPAWEPPGPPRWFRSNAGGMTLEELPSRLAALRHAYALVIDYIPPDEIEPRLLPYYQNGYTVEVRTLHEQGAQSRRQWLFRDESGVARLNAVFLPPPPREQPDKTEPAPLADSDTAEDDALDELAAEFPGAASPDTAPEAPSGDEPQASRDTALSVGFIEVFDEQSRITEERQFFDDDGETLIIYAYNAHVLVTAEARNKKAGAEYLLAYVDYYRYNRSYSLRHVERQFHDGSSRQPVRLTFPGRVLDAAADRNFIGDKLMVTSDFFGSFFAGEGYRMIYTTDNRGRILTQTMLNHRDEEVWVIVNTWAGDRIVAMRKTEGEDVKVTEYEYDGAGNRIVQRDIHNDVLERLVRTDGANETEELYLNETLVLRAYWVNGRKVSEERVRRR